MGSHSATVLSAALTAITRSAASTITIPGKTGQMNTLVAIEAQAFGTLESAVVGAGGLVELENDGIDWIPLNFYTEYNDAVTSTSSGAAEILTTKFKVNQKLPAGSIVSCYFTPIDNQSLKFSVTIHWIEGGPSGSLTYMKGGKGSAVTAATKASDHITIAVPSGKGGKLKAIWAVPIGIIEVAGSAPWGAPGGRVQMRNQSADPSWDPTEFYTNSAEVLVAGAAHIYGKLNPVDLDLPGNSSAIADYTPMDDLTQYLSITLIWEK